VFVEKAVKEETAADIAKVRKIYIRQADLDAFGYTPGCKKCQSILGREKRDLSATIRHLQSETHGRDI